MLSELIIDALLVFLMVAVALLSFWHRRIFASAVFFIVFGLLLSITWLRLSAPDVALTEAAIGAGITGALVIATLARLSAAEPESEERED